MVAGWGLGSLAAPKRRWLAVVLALGLALGASTLLRAIDNFANFAVATVSTGYDASATSIVLTTGHGALLPTAPFNCTWFNSTDNPDLISDTNKEIVRATAKSTDTLTIARGQEGTSAHAHNTAGKVYKLDCTITKKFTDDIAAEFAGPRTVATGGTGASTLPAGALLKGNGTSAVTGLVGATAGDIPYWNGSAWVTQAAPTLIPFTAVTGAQTITYGGTYYVTGTSANYTLAIDTCDAGHDQSSILVMMGNASELTKLVTLDPASSQTINGQTTRIMWANESATLVCRGSTGEWRKNGGVSIPMTVFLTRTTNQTGLVTSTWTQVLMTSRVSGIAAMFDSGNSRATILRPGYYVATSGGYFSGAAGGQASYWLTGFNSFASVYANFTYGVGSPVLTGTVSSEGTAAAGDWIAAGYFVEDAATIINANSATSQPFLAVREVPTW